MSKKVLVFLAALAVLSGCKKDDPSPAKADPAASTKTESAQTAATDNKDKEKDPSSPLAVNDTPPTQGSGASTATAAKPSDDPVKTLQNKLDQGHTSPTALVAAAPTVKLISAGNDPKAPMRFHVTKGATQSVLMTMIMGMGMAGNQVKLPAIKMGMTTTITDVMANGNIRYDYKMDKIDMADDGGLPADKLAQMKQMFQGMENIKGHMVVTDRGFVREADLEVPANVNPQIKQMMDSLKQSMGQIVSPLPEEAVGPGAKWEVLTTLTQNGMTLNQKATYELVSRTGDTGKTKITISQNADHQTIHAPNMPANVNVELNSLTTTGNGGNEFDLTKLAPITSDLKMATNMSMAAQGQTMAMSMDVQIKLTPK